MGNMKKFELTTEFVEKYGRKLFRIKALIKFHIAHLPFNLFSNTALWLI